MRPDGARPISWRTGRSTARSFWRRAMDPSRRCTLPCCRAPSRSASSPSGWKTAGSSRSPSTARSSTPSRPATQPAPDGFLPSMSATPPTSSRRPSPSRARPPRVPPERNSLLSKGRLPMRLHPRLLACLLTLPLMLGSAFAQDKPKLKLGFAKCTHCTPLVLLPDHVKDVDIDVIGFNTGNDVLTALVSKSIDIAQVTYLHYATALDKGFDVVAVSGQVNGGSQLLLANDLPVKEGDWAGLKALIAERNKAGKPFRVAASRGNAQDIHMRGAFTKQGIDMRKDVEFINIPNPS